ncbi:hypothetical protein FYJ79_06760 [Sharpea azabuensis]|uniref:Uncharacterized protein n=1 Tax=Sharpea porci TaxID=2652286 RepID=A0A844FU97_9FIRM|nr:hypothetical protein [Sharpea porci]MST89274.1 hypothetical protein [Sharpea porci]
MACFLVPTTEAIVTSVASKKLNAYVDESEASDLTIHFIKNMKTLNSMLLGGSALLMFEHLWHGEITPFFPFLTAASSPQQFTAMLKEMATVGVTMALFVTFVWVVMTLVTFKMQLPYTKVSEEVHS